MNPELLFETHNIGKTYGDNTVLQGINLHINRGEIIGLIGENGAGKSTLLKIISGVEEPSAGTMEMSGKPFRASSMLDANRKGVGMVFQEQSLISNLSVAQNIYLGREKDFAHRHLVSWKKMNARAKTVLDAMGLTTITPKTKVRDISFSMRQMVEITKVLDIISETAKDRALILLDEPTTVLSDDEIKVLFQEIRKMKERGNSIIFISHRLAEVLEISERIYVFKDGRQTAEVPTAQANEFSLYEKMVGRETNGEYYMNGLETIVELRRIDPAIRFVILTSHDKFEYAHEAIRLGVEDYILKPAGIARLRKSIGQVVDKLEHDQAESLRKTALLERMESLRPILERDCVYTLITDRSAPITAEDFRFLDTPVNGGFCFVLSCEGAPQAWLADVRQSLERMV